MISSRQAPTRSLSIQGQQQRFDAKSTSQSMTEHIRNASVKGNSTAIIEEIKKS